MNPFRVIAIVAGVWGAFIGTWGLVTHGGTQAVDGDVQSMNLWIGMGLFSLGIAVVASQLAARNR